MKRREKIMIAVLVAITVVVIIFAITRKGENEVANTDIIPEIEANTAEPVEEYVAVAEDGTKVNTSEALASNKVVNGVELTDIQLTEKNGETMLIATVKNTGTTANELFAVDVTLIDDAGQDIVTVGGLVPPLEPGATGQFETSMTLDYANAYDFRVTAK